MPPTPERYVSKLEVLHSMWRLILMRRHNTPNVQEAQRCAVEEMKGIHT